MHDDDCYPDCTGGTGTSASTRATAMIRFRVEGLPRFLSHAETQRVLERACVRAGMPLRYSEGFNPHPRLSLPLPRPVGVQSDDEMLVARLTDGAGPFEDRPTWEAATQQALNNQLPDGITVFAVTLAASHATIHPQSAQYVLPLRILEEADRLDQLRDRIASVLASETCIVDRSTPEGPLTRRIDVRPFLDEVRLEGENLVVRYRISPAGSIRVEEILQVFGLQTEDLAGPVCRTKVMWGQHDEAK